MSKCKILYLALMTLAVSVHAANGPVHVPDQPVTFTFASMSLTSGFYVQLKLPDPNKPFTVEGPFLRDRTYEWETRNSSGGSYGVTYRSQLQLLSASAVDIYLGKSRTGSDTPTLCRRGAVQLPFTINCAHAGTGPVLMILSSPGTLYTTATNVKIAWGNGLPLSGHPVPNGAQIDVSVKVRQDSYVEEYSAVSYCGVRSLRGCRVTTSGTWGTGLIGVSTSASYLTCRTNVVGVWSECGSLRMSYTSEKDIDLNAYVVYTPVVNTACKVRAGGVVLSNSSRPIDTPPADPFVQEVTRDLQMEVTCKTPGTYRIPVVFNRQYR